MARLSPLVSRLFLLAKYKLTVTVKLCAEFTSQFLDAGRSSVLDDVLDGEGRGSRVQSRGRGNHLISHAGDAQPQPIELPEGRRNDAEIGIKHKLGQNDCR